MRAEECTARSGKGERGAVARCDKGALRCSAMRRWLGSGARIALSLMLAVFLAVPIAALQVMSPRGGGCSKRAEGVCGDGDKQLCRFILL